MGALSRQAALHLPSIFHLFSLSTLLLPLPDPQLLEVNVARVEDWRVSTSPGAFELQEAGDLSGCDVSLGHELAEVAGETCLRNAGFGDVNADLFADVVAGVVDGDSVVHFAVELDITEIGGGGWLGGCFIGGGSARLLIAFGGFVFPCCNTSVGEEGR